MAAFVWQTRAAPSLHGSTFAEFVWEDMQPRFDTSFPNPRFSSFVRLNRQEAFSWPVAESPYFRCVRLSEVNHTDADRCCDPLPPLRLIKETGSLSWPKNSSARMAYAASPARRRWI